MERLSSIPPSVWARITAKLGRCPRCLRASARGTLVAWGVATILVIVWPHPLALAGALVLAGGFTLLLVSHLVAYMGRLARRLRQVSAGPEPGLPAATSSLSRRELLWTVGKAGSLAVLVALVGRPLGVSAQPACAGVHAPGLALSGTGASRKAAVDAYDADAVAKCDAFCLARGCPAGSKCLRSGAAGRSTPKCTKDNVTDMWTCTGQLTACPCDCFACDATNVPPPPQNQAVGTGNTQELARAAVTTDAEAKCEAFCQLIDTCPGEPQPPCRLFGAPTVINIKCTGNRQQGFTCTGTITNCPCTCQT